MVWLMTTDAKDKWYDDLGNVPNGLPGGLAKNITSGSAGLLINLVIISWRAFNYILVPLADLELLIVSDNTSYAPLAYHPIIY